MIEVRSAYLVYARNIRNTMALWKEGREKIWPELGFSGRIQQMLHGHVQQSLFVWSSEWQSMADWEAGMARTLDSQNYKEWSAEMNKLRVYGEEREVFKILEPRLDMDNSPGKVEIRSSYMIQIQNLPTALKLFSEGQEKVWPEMGWGGQNQQMLHGKASQSMLVWTSTWDSIDTWEKAMSKTVGNQTFQDWYKKWLDVVDFGGPREIFKNI